MTGLALSFGEGFRHIRSLIAVGIMLGTPSCGAPLPPTITRIEIWAAGIEASIDERGRGQFLKQPSRERGTFALDAAQFARLVTRMEVFRRSGDTIAAEDMPEYALRGGRCSGRYVTDQGGISLHWTGPSIDEFYTVDFGCDPEGNAARNAELRAILRSLPVPAPSPLP